jgi:hypothetical protein
MPYWRLRATCAWIFSHSVLPNPVQTHHGADGALEQKNGTRASAARCSCPSSRKGVLAEARSPALARRALCYAALVSSSPAMVTSRSAPADFSEVR